jgi:hypothetical protein
MEGRSKLDRLEWLAEWSKLWRDLVAAFPHSKPADRAMELYAEYLADIPADALRASVRQAIATCRFMPTIAELRDACRAVSGGSDESTALVAYGRTMEELSQARGESRAARLDDPIAREVVKALGGGHYLLSSDSRSTDRAHFVHAYRELAERRAAEERIAPQARAALGTSDATGLPELNTPKPRLRLVADIPPPPANPDERMAPEEWAEHAKMLKAEIKHAPPSPSGFRLLASIEPLATAEPSGLCRLCASPLPDDESGCATCRARAERRRRELLDQAERAEGA